MTPFLLAITLTAAWLAGGLANWAADTLPSGAPVFRRTTVPTLWSYWTPTRRYAQVRLPGARGPQRWRAPLLDLALMLAFALTLRLAAPGWTLVGIGWLYNTFLLIVLVIDYEHRRVLNRMLAPAAVAVLGLSLLPQSPVGLPSALLGGAVGLGLFLLFAILSRGALGAGDVKLAGLIGLMVGYPGVVAALILGAILAAAAAVALLVTRRATRRSTMAYAPYLAMGALAVFWFGGR